MNSIETLLANAKGITANSNEVKEGYIFFAIKGANFDGNDFIDDALENGAIGIVYEGEYPPPQPSPSRGEGVTAEQGVGIVVENARKTLAESAAKFYAKPPKHIVAITGTDGKTSVANICRQMWQLMGVKSASIGTMGVQRDNSANNAVNTSPDPVSLHKTLAQLANDGVEYVAIEASSIGIEQYRLDGVNFTAGGFTNFTRDHLDYHGNLENYFNAKRSLFNVLLKNKPAILNTDYEKIAQLACEIKTAKTYGKSSENLKLLEINPINEGLEITFQVGQKRHTVKTNLFGEFQAYNILCAIGLVHETGFAIEDIIKIIPKLQPIAGRLEQVEKNIFVDYAHTPDALRNALQSLRKHTEGKLIVVFGCGGDRDRGKRPLMGEIADENADTVIITDDNPRNENPENIRNDILLGISSEEIYNIGDRAEAIKKGVSLMNEGDILLVAGKGHENYQIIGNTKIHFSDQEAIKTTLART